MAIVTSKILTSDKFVSSVILGFYMTVYIMKYYLKVSALSVQSYIFLNTLFVKTWQLN